MAGKMRRKNKAQISVFIIIGVVLVAGVILAYAIFSKTGPRYNTPTAEDPQQYIEKCVKDSVSEAEPIILKQGGYINPGNFKLYQDEKVAYLCYTNLFYEKCTNQEPMFIKHIEDEITNYTKNRIDVCFSNLKNDLEKQNYAIEMSGMDMKTELLKNTIRVTIDRKMSITRNEETKRFDKFNVLMNSPLYNLANVAIEIANQEAKRCSFEYVGYMAFYPEFKIERISVGNGETTSRMYVIEDKNTEKKLNIAIRGCAIPAGI